MSPLPDQHPYYKPKLTAAAVVFLVATIAMFTGFLTGGEWVTIATLTLTVYSASTVAENKFIMGAP